MIERELEQDRFKKFLGLIWSIGQIARIPLNIYSSKIWLNCDNEFTNIVSLGIWLHLTSLNIHLQKVSEKDSIGLIKFRWSSDFLAK